MFNSCVDAHGHSECGLGLLCDRNCMPPLYLLVTLSFAMSAIITVTGAPIVLFIYYYDRYKKN